MPHSSQSLYFHLAMRADDDGFVQPKAIMRLTGANQDDLKVLLAKRFLLPFESGVVVIKHWLIHNMIRTDRYKPTRFAGEKSLLFLKENNAYTDNSNKGKSLLATKWQPNGNHPAPQVRLGKVRLGESNHRKAAQSAAGSKPKFTKLGAEVIKLFEEVDPKNKTYYANTTQRAAADFLISEYGLDAVRQRVSVLPKTNKLAYFPTITTPVQLRDKWVQLQDAVERKRNERSAKQTAYVI